VHRGVAQLAVADHGPGFQDNVVQEVAAKTTPLGTNPGSARYHTAQFRDLAPRAKYVYRVGDGVTWSEWSHFSTASDEEAPFSFVYLGDAQNEIKSHWSRVVREAYRDEPTAAFLLHAGDLVNLPEDDAEWGEWFYATSFVHRITPAVATPGNHEYHRVKDAAGHTIGSRLTRHWRPSFAFPENGPPELAESVYWFDYQGTRIISLNSNERHEQQASWLRRVLTDNPQRWTIVTFHHPLYSSRAGRDNRELRALWQPIFDEYGVDLVLQGHDHAYARTTKMTFQEGSLEQLVFNQENVTDGVITQPRQGGTVYVVSVSGPKMYALEAQPFVMRAAEDTQLYQVISIEGRQLRYEARTAIGQLYDAFTLQKGPQQTNRLIELMPDAPDRRRHQATGRRVLPAK
jgi:3',5'-cyclic AMP phosphodiesterase CpdA